MVNEWLRMPDDNYGDFSFCIMMMTWLNNYDDDNGENYDDDADDDDDLQGNPLLRRPDDRLKSTDFAVVGSL